LLAQTGHWGAATIPIVFTGIDDPVASGFVASLNRPGGNMRGMSVLNKDIGAKRFELLREMSPQDREARKSPLKTRDRR
jgi:putative tryptophan/tyrosine transport system substrate-binding protein